MPGSAVAARAKVTQTLSLSCHCRSRTESPGPGDRHESSRQVSAGTRTGPRATHLPVCVTDNVKPGEPPPSETVCSLRPPAHRRAAGKCATMNLKLALFVSRISIVLICESAKYDKIYIRDKAQSMNNLYSNSEFPTVTFSVSATTTGYEYVKHKKQAKATKPKPKAKAVVGFTLTSAVENNYDADIERNREAERNEPSQLHTTVIDSADSPAVRDAKGVDSKQDTIKQSEVESDHDSDDVGKGASSSNSDSEQEDETAMMKALGLPVCPRHGACAISSSISASATNKSRCRCRADLRCT